jgi:hypothetical protein
MIPAASRLSRPMMVGRKYSRIMESRVSTVHPFGYNLGAADTPRASIHPIRSDAAKCFLRHHTDFAHAPSA